MDKKGTRKTDEGNALRAPEHSCTFHCFEKERTVRTFLSAGDELLGSAHFRFNCRPHCRLMPHGWQCELFSKGGNHNGR